MLVATGFSRSTVRRARPFKLESVYLCGGLRRRASYNAAPMVAGVLTKRGGTLILPGEGFGVKDTKGPLVEGDLERAATWAQQLARV